MERCEPAHAELVHKLRSLIDPHGIMAPGRYAPSPRLR
jgi:hypothetical protein